MKKTIPFLQIILSFLLVVSLGINGYLVYTHITTNTASTELQNQLSVLENTVSDLQAEIDSNQNTINDLKSEKANIQNDIHSNNYYITSEEPFKIYLEEQLAELTAKLEDSQSGGNNSNSGNGESSPTEPPVQSTGGASSTAPNTDPTTWQGNDLLGKPNLNFGGGEQDDIDLDLH